MRTARDIDSELEIKIDEMCQAWKVRDLPHLKAVWCEIDSLQAERDDLRNYQESVGLSGRALVSIACSSLLGACITYLIARVLF